MNKKEQILELMENAQLTDTEVLKEEENLLLVQFFYDFDQDELDAAQSFANSEKLDEDADEVTVEGQKTVEEPDLAYEEEDEYLGDAKQKYLAEIAIDHVGEVLEDIQEELGVEIQYVGYDLEEDEYDAFEFVAVIFEKGKAIDIEDLLDELDI